MAERVAPVLGWLSIPIVSQWPDGKYFVVFDCREDHKPVRVCWTPDTREWAQVRQILGGLAEMGK